DSKKLDAATRADLFERIVDYAHAIGIGLASAAEIDALNIRRATFLAMRRAIRALPIAPAHVHVDGNALPDDLPCAAQTLVQGDALCLSIAAASIIAKVTRDRLMIRLHQQDTRYGFNSHMGYGTPAHLAALERHGPSRFHRRSFAPVRNRLAVTEV
ncbi:MAG TPA: ribonuclease HII, partial [Casimicrobiaceae bacterium]